MQEELDVQKNQNQSASNASSSLGGPGSGDSSNILPAEIEHDDGFSDSVKAKKKYRDVADAAQAAFESAAFAAAAARAAVELSRSGHDSDNQDSPGSQRGKSAPRFEPMKMESESEEEQVPVANQTGELRRSLSSSPDAIIQGNPSDKDVVFDESDSETITGKHRIHQTQKQIPSRFQDGLEDDSVHQNSREDDTASSGTENSMRLNLEKGPLSLRTRRVRGY